MSRTHWIATGVGIFATCWLVLGSAVASQTGVERVRIVVAVDNSLSMSQRLEGFAPSDPNRERIAGVHTLVDALAAVQSARKDTQYPVEYSLGVVSFGERAHVAMQSGTLDPSAIRSRVREEAIDGTDFRPALCLSWVMATGQVPPDLSRCRLMSADVTEAQRTSALQPGSTAHVTIITDGDAFVGGAGLSAAGGSHPENCDRDRITGSQHAYYCELRDIWRDLNAKATVTLRVVGLDASNQWFPGVEPYWRALAGCAPSAACDRVTRNVDPQRIIEPISPVQTVLCAPACDLPGALQSVAFHVRGLPAGARVSVVDPSGRRYDEGSGRMSRPAPESQTWQFPAPQKGRWSVEAIGAGGSTPQLQVAATLIQAKMTLSTQPAEIQSGRTFNLVASFGGNETPVHEASFVDEQFRLQTRFGGKESRADVKLERNGPGQYRITPAPRLDGEGTWSVELSLVQAGTASGQSLVLGSAEVNVRRTDRDGGDTGGGHKDGEAGVDGWFVLAVVIAVLLLPILCLCSYRWPSTFVSGKQFGPRHTLGRMYLQTATGDSSTPFRPLWPARRLRGVGVLSLRFLVAGPVVVRSTTSYFERPPRNATGRRLRPIRSLIVGSRVPLGRNPAQLNERLSVTRSS